MPSGKQELWLDHDVFIADHIDNRARLAEVVEYYCEVQAAYHGRVKNHRQRLAQYDALIAKYQKCKKAHSRALLLEKLSMMWSDLDARYRLDG